MSEPNRKAAHILVETEASARSEWCAAEEVVRVLEGKAPQNPVNRIVCQV